MQTHRFILISSLLFLSQCGLFKDDSLSHEAADTFCSCLQESMPPLDNRAIDAVILASEDIDHFDIDAYSDSLRTVLPASDFQRFEQSVEAISNILDDDAAFDSCAEAIVQQYPEIDEMEDERIVEILTNYSDPERCRFTAAVIKILAE